MGKNNRRYCYSGLLGRMVAYHDPFPSLCTAGQRYGDSLKSGLLYYRLCCLCKGMFNGTSRNGLGRVFQWSGAHSLEIYLTHYLLLSLLKMAETPITGSIQGTALMIGNYVITVALTVLTVKLLNTNKTLRLVLYGSRSCFICRKGECERKSVNI